MLKVPSLTPKLLGAGAAVLQALPVPVPKGPVDSPHVRGELHGLVRNARDPSRMVMSCRQKHR